MMMQALNAGGIGAVYVPQLEGGNPDYNNYQPNPGGLYEMGLGQYMHAKILRGIPDNCVVKILFDGLPNLPQNFYKIIWMSRNLSEIEASTKRVDEHILGQPGRQRGLANKADEITGILPFCVYRPYNQDDMDHVKGICEARSDMEVIDVDYGDVIDRPLSIFESLVKCGIPIDPEKAAAIVNPKLYRVRSKNDDRTRRFSRNTAQSISNEQPATQKTS